MRLTPIGSTAGTPRTRWCSGWRAPASTGLLLAVALGLFLRGFPASPTPDYDEIVLFSIPRNAAAFSTYDYRALFADFANSAEHPKLPPLSLALRIAWHRLVGPSHTWTRALSVLEGLAIAITVMAWLHRLRAPAWLLGLGGAVLLVNPTYWLTFRTLRSEQDLLLFGFLGLSLPHVLATPRLQGAAWSASGVLVGWAVSSHPYGLIILLIQVVGLAAAHGPMGGSGGRIVRFVAGLSMPLAGTALWYLSDLENTRRFIGGMRQYYAAVAAHNVRVFQDWFIWPAWLPASNAWRASINTLLMGSEPREGTGYYWLDHLLRGVGWTSLAATWLAGGVVTARVLARAVTRRVNLEQRSEVVVAPLLVGPFVATSFHAFQMPTNNYLIYPEVFSMAALVAWTSVVVSRDGPRQRRPLWTGRLLVAALWVYAGGFVIAGTLAAGRPAAMDWPIEADLRAQEKLSQRLSLAPRDAGGELIYTDLASWAAGGRRLWPSFEYLTFWPGAPLHPRVAWVVDSRAHRSLFDFPSASDELLGSATRRARLDQLLDGLKLAGAIVYEPSQAGGHTFSRLWYVRQAAVPSANLDKLEILWFRGGDGGEYTAGDHRILSPREARAEPLPTNGTISHEWVVSLLPGLYAFSASLANTETMVLSAEIVCRPGNARQGRLDYLPQDQPGLILPFEVPKGGDQAIRVVVTASDAAGRSIPAPPRLHVWKLTTRR